MKVEEEKKETEVKSKVKRVKKEKTKDVKAEEPKKETVSAKKLRAKRQTKKNPMNQLSSVEPAPQNDEDNEEMSHKYNIKIYCLESEEDEEDEQEEFILQSIFDRIVDADTDEDEFY